VGTGRAPNLKTLLMQRDRLVDTWEAGDPYERYIGRWSRRIAPPFLLWLNVPAGRRWLDVGCGTGALSAAILDHCAPAEVTGIEPSPGFLRAATRTLAGRATIAEGNAMAIPLADRSVEVVVSGLVLNFVPDQPAALAEMVRAVAPGGTVASYVWDYAGRMDMLRLFWGAAADLDPAAADLDEGARFPLCRPEALTDLFAGAGLAAIETTAIDIETPFVSFDDLWDPFTAGQGPAPTYVASITEGERQRLRELMLERVTARTDGSIVLGARAWAVRARRT